MRTATNYFPIILMVLIGLLHTTNSLQCFDCHSTHSGELQCNDACEGDLCIVWKWKTKAELHIKQGCMKGIDALIVCRRNHVGAQLCICDDDPFCNRVERAENTIRPLPTRYLPSVECVSRVQGSPLVTRRQHNCRSNYCHYTSSTTSFGSMGTDTLLVANCAEHPQYDFDVRIHSTIDFPGIYPNGIYRIGNVPNTYITSYICSTSNCTSRPPPKLEEGDIQCYVYATRRNKTIEDTVHEKVDFCTGHFCFIQIEGEKISKGCLSTNERQARYTTKIGHRRLLSTEQWICNRNLCNYDLERMKRSWKPLPIQIPSGQDSIMNRIRIPCFLVLLIYQF